MIHLLDQDGHTVKMSREDVARSLREMGNPEGEYMLVHPDTKEPHTFDTVLRIRPCIYPKYSWLQMLMKRWKGSRLLDRKIPVTFMGQMNQIEEKGSSVWLHLKYNERHVIYVD